MGGFSAKRQKVDDKWKQFHSEQEVTELTLSPDIIKSGFTSTIPAIYERVEDIIAERKSNMKEKREQVTRDR